MVVARIVIKENYENKNDLVLRSYVRALRSLGNNPYFDEDKAYIYGTIDDENAFHELFTNKLIPYDNYQIIDEKIFKDDFKNLGVEIIYSVSQIIKKLIFNEDSKYNIVEMEELAKDRAVEFDAYIKNLTSHNPYSEPLNGYNNFSFKCNELQKVKKMV